MESPNIIVREKGHVIASGARDVQFSLANGTGRLVLGLHEEDIVRVWLTFDAPCTFSGGDSARYEQTHVAYLEPATPSLAFEGASGCAFRVKLDYVGRASANS